MMSHQQRQAASSLWVILRRRKEADLPSRQCNSRLPIETAVRACTHIFFQGQTKLDDWYKPMLGKIFNIGICRESAVVRQPQLWQEVSMSCWLQLPQLGSASCRRFPMLAGANPLTPQVTAMEEEKALQWPC